MVVVSHDREFLDQLCTKIVETERGVSETYKGNYTAYLAAKAERTAQQWSAWEKQQKEIARLVRSSPWPRSVKRLASRARARTHADLGCGAGNADRQAGGGRPGGARDERGEAAGEDAGRRADREAVRAEEAVVHVPERGAHGPARAATGRVDARLPGQDPLQERAAGAGEGRPRRYHRCAPLPGSGSSCSVLCCMPSGWRPVRPQARTDAASRRCCG